MKKILPFSFIVIAAMILAACGGAPAQEAPMEFYSVSPEMGGAPAISQDAAMPPPSEPGARSAEQAAGNPSGVAATSVERIVIKNADLAIVVANVEGRMKAIQQMAEKMGGFVVSSNLYQSYTSNYVEVPEAQIVIRVPSEKLEEALDQIKKDAVEVQTENISGQDVTAEYVDLQSRLKNYEAAEAQLNKILENATDTTDVVNIFNQLVYYREQIEVVKGQIKYYDEAAALSAISVRIVAEETIQPVVIGKWEPKGVALEAVQDLVDFLKNFTDFMIRFVIRDLPIMIIIAIPLHLVFLGARAVFRRMRGKKVKKEEVKEEEKK
jgi:hemerythrin-like domain-containing protein